MKRHTLAFLVVGFAVVLNCSKKSPVTPESSGSNQSDMSSTEVLATEIITQSGWVLDETALEECNEGHALMKWKRNKAAETGRIVYVNRIPLGGNIVHYAFKIFVGPSMYDVIGLHRVVKEKRPFQPIKTHKTFFYQHGDAKDFKGMTLPGSLSPSTPRDFGIAVFLARNDVDVWGIDQSWTLTPVDIAESSFMKDWGLQRQVDDLSFCLSIARFIRLFTGSGFSPMILCGYSSGVVTGFALLNEETQIPRAFRNVSGFIPVDVPVKTNDEIVKKVFEDEYARVKALMDGGDYADMMAFPYVAEFARSDPDGESPIFPGFTNMQLAYFFGAGALYGTIHYHFLAGIYENDFPVDFEYVTLDQWLDFMAAGPPWESAPFIADYCKMIADIEDIPFDDHFARITVPIFLVGAAGGMGDWAIYGTTLMGSTDVSHHIVRFKSPEEVLYDFAHIDLFLANNARMQVWQPILDWINSHTLHLP